MQLFSNSSHEKYNKTIQLKRTEYSANCDQSDEKHLNTHTTYYEVIFTHQWSSLEMKRCPTVFLLSKLSVIFSDLPVYEGIHFQLKAWLGCVNEITRWPSWQHPQRLLLCRTAATCHLSEMSNTIAQACISSEIKSDSSIKHFIFLHLQFGSKTVTDMLHTLAFSTFHAEKSYFL